MFTKTINKYHRISVWTHIHEWCKKKSISKQHKNIILNGQYLSRSGDAKACLVSRGRKRGRGFLFQSFELPPKPLSAAVRIPALFFQLVLDRVPGIRSMAGLDGWENVEQIDLVQRRLILTDNARIFSFLRRSHLFFFG